MDWMADDASLGISQYVPSLPEEIKPPDEAQTLSARVGVCVGVEKYTRPSSLPNRSQWAACALGLPGLDGVWVRANGRLLD